MLEYVTFLSRVINCMQRELSEEDKHKYTKEIDLAKEKLIKGTIKRQ